MKYKVYVDGQEGTTGLKIHERLAARSDLDILKIDPEKRKDPEERSKLLNEADIAFLCLPDAASKEAVSFVHNPHTRIIDASTAHRTLSDWAYGLPELSSAHRNAIASSSRVAVPGCYASGFNLLMYPLIKEGIVPADYPVTCHAVSGYSGAGKKMIEQYEAPDGRDKNLDSPRFYALGLAHKHLPEMQKISGLAFPPLFSPIINPIFQGMIVAVPLVTRLLPGKPGAREVQEFMATYYDGQTFVKVAPFESDAWLEQGFLGALACNETNVAQLFVFGHNDQILLAARLDNLGKGASGAAVQNMNIMLGLDETTGL